ncbi:MAG: DUF2281 domain-containing protein [Limnothrix sp. RL_2_0]|nr:DUF2281 domain-containing protein [Limnothrix sp. RL_2_0]
MPDSILLEKINALPDALKTEVEHYIEFLLEKYAKTSSEAPTSEPKKYRQAGILAGKIWMSDDFDEPLEEMKEYM